MTRLPIAAVLCLASGAMLAQAQSPRGRGADYRPDPTVKPVPGYRLVWSDEFNVPGRPSSAKWAFEQGFCRNRELQWYQAKNAYCQGGVLVIVGRKERVANPRYKPGSSDWKTSRRYAEYTSASLNTWGKFSWDLSKSLIRVRARITPQPGYFPAIWTTGPGQWPHGGEVDLMEYYKGRILANFAWGTTRQWNAHWHEFHNPNHGDKNKPRITYFLKKDKNWLAKFHVWELKGDDKKVQIFLDGELMNEVTHEVARNPKTRWSNVVYPFKQKHSLILNLAIGGPGGDPSKARFPMRYEVDYARVYERK